MIINDIYSFTREYLPWIHGNEWGQFLRGSKKIVNRQYLGDRKEAPQLLFVDDDEDDMLLFDLAIHELKIQFNLHYVSTGDSMFQLLNHITPDLIFLDLHLPGKSGISCLKMLRYQSTYDHVPIIIYSRFNKTSLINDCYSAKANYYIVKPPTVPKISEAVKKVFTTNWEAERYPRKENFVIAFEPDGV